VKESFIRKNLKFKSEIRRNPMKKKEFSYNSSQTKIADIFYITKYL